MKGQSSKWIGEEMEIWSKTSDEKWKTLVARKMNLIHDRTKKLHSYDLSAEML